MPRGEKWEKRVTKERKHKRVIRNPDFPDLGILRRSLSKKRGASEGERGASRSEQLDTCGVFAKEEGRNG